MCHVFNNCAMVVLSVSCSIGLQQAMAHYFKKIKCVYSDCIFYSTNYFGIVTGCFLVWMIISTNADPVYRDPTVAIGNCFNATALLIMLPLRKLKLMCSAKKERLHIYSCEFLLFTG